MTPSALHAPGRPAGLVLPVVAIYILLLPVQIRVTGTLRVAPADLFIAMALVLLAVGGGLRLRRGAFSPWHLLLLGMFVLGIAVTAFRDLAASRYVLLNKGVGILVLAASYVVIASVATSWTRVRWLLRLFVISAVIHTMVAMAAFAARYGAGIQVPMMNPYSLRLSGMLVDPNAFGGLLVLALAVVMAAGVRPRPLIGGLPGLAASLVLAVGILLTFSRSAWLALGVVLIVVSLYDLRMALRAAVLSVVGFIALIMVSGLDYLTTIIRLAFRGGTAHARLEFIEVALEEFAARPILGTGLGYFLGHHGFVIHNTPVWVLAEFGILGFAMFAGFLAWFLWAGVRTFRRAPPAERPLVLGLVLAFLSMAALSAGIEALYQRHWWLVMALIASAHALVVNGRRETVPVAEAPAPARV